MEFSVDLLYQPRDVLPKGGAALDSVKRGEDGDEPVFFRGLVRCLGIFCQFVSTGAGALHKIDTYQIQPKAQVDNFAGNSLIYCTLSISSMTSNLQ